MSRSSSRALNSSSGDVIHQAPQHLAADHCSRECCPQSPFPSPRSRTCRQGRVSNTLTLIRKAIQDDWQDTLQVHTSSGHSSSSLKTETLLLRRPKALHCGNQLGNITLLARKLLFWFKVSSNPVQFSLKPFMVSNDGQSAPWCC